MTDQGHECYLCGNKNDPGASFCARCNGQLLSLGSEPEPSAPEPEPVPEVVEESQPKEEKTGRLRQLRRKSTLDDSRLSDALGLSQDGEDSLADIATPQVTAVPKAKSATDIPLLGTRSRVGPALRDEDPGRRVLVLLGLLVLATAWLGWTTLSGREPAGPTVASATPTSTTTTTTPTTSEAPLIEWNESEAEGQFGDSLVLVQLISCAGEGTTAEAAGVNINEHTTLIDTSPLPSARSARIFSRSGTSRVAVITTKSTGATVAVSPTRVTSHADIETDPIGEPRFQLQLEAAANRVSITRVNSISELGGDAVQLLVNGQGDASAARVGGRTFTQEQLADSVDTVIPVEGAEGSADDPCTWPAALAFASNDGAPTTEPTDEPGEESSEDTEEATQ